ncbi:MAG TPA: GAF domain-containing protein, partial [Candidatus Methylomirabilis sp.]|nr:GAF domain-containing protein [Candidatus Methylomirabilis sp.]
MRCSQCRKQTPSGANFCPQCGAQLALICRDCGTANSRARKLCMKCRRPLKTAAAPRTPGQPAIAAEIARLSKELQARSRDLTEALEQQTATSEILRVISSSPIDIQPVLDAVAENAARVCGANDAQIFRIDGELLRLVSSYGPLPVLDRFEDGVLANRGWVTGRAVVDRQTIHVHDLADESETEFPEGRIYAKRFGHRTTLATPLLRTGVPIGAILIRRMEVRPFSEKQIELLRTFADQAVIAIENVRLFKEIQERNRDLTEALDQQTATSEVLRVISGSPTDAQPVFDMIARRAAELCNGEFGLVFRFDGELIHFVAHHNLTPDGVEAFRRSYPMPPNTGTASGRSILNRALVQIPDVN